MHLGHPSWTPLPIPRESGRAIGDAYPQTVLASSRFFLTLPSIYFKKRMAMCAYSSKYSSYFGEPYSVAIV